MAASLDTPAQDGSKPVAPASDPEPGADALDIERDVAAFSRVILARDLAPPLTIGLFGDRGTGKTFFLETLQRRIARDAARARAQEAAGDTPAWLTHPAQITFNARHHVESDPWTSLLVHLFDALGRLVEEPEEDPRAARARLMRNLESAREARKQAAGRYLASKKQRAKARARAAHVRRTLERARTQHTQLCNSNLLRLVTDVVMDRARKRARKAGSELAGELGRATEEWTRAAVSLRSTRGRIQALITWMLTGPRRGFALTLLVLGCLGWTLLIPALSWSFSELRTWGSGVFLLLAGSGTGMLRSWKVVREPLDEALAYIDGSRARLVRASRSPRARALSPFTLAVEDARSQIDSGESALARAQQALARASAAVEAAAHAVAEARQGRQLFRGMAERADCDDQRQHPSSIGLVDRIRRDLDRLATLVGVPDRGHAPLPAQDRVARIDRIVLYIDDLDRCPPERVVEVLQAVHLLLGMRLFVVVVAVDPCWLLRSLDQHDAALLRELSQRDDIRPSTARDDLQTIFQIPYVLDRMDQRGYAQMIDSLVDGEEPAPRAGTPGPGAAEPMDQVPVEALLRISRDERLFMHRLHPLIATPRAVKSFVNIVKLVRARLERPRRGEPSLATYLAEGEYRVALLLLAIGVGHSAQASLLGEALTRGEHTESWQGFLEQLQISPNPEGLPSNRIAGTLDEAQAASWQAIVDCLGSLHEAGEIPDDLARYEPWVRRMRQFSFDPWRASTR